MLYKLSELGAHCLSRVGLWWALSQVTLYWHKLLYGTDWLTGSVILRVILSVILSRVLFKKYFYLYFYWRQKERRGINADTMLAYTRYFSFVQIKACIHCLMNNRYLQENTFLNHFVFQTHRLTSYSEGKSFKTQETSTDLSYDKY